jgi:hypothetical protein
MAAFGDIFRSPKLEGVEESGENGQGGRIVGLDLESGVVRLTARRPAEPDRPAEDPPQR